MSAGQSFSGMSSMEAISAWHELVLGKQSGNFSIDWTLGNFQAVILGASGLVISAPAAGVGNFQLKVAQDAVGSRTLPAFDPAIVWIGGTPPILSTAPGAVDFLQFYCDSVNFFGIKKSGRSSELTFPILAPDGTFTGPSYSFSSQPSNGFYRPSNNIIAWTVNSSPRFAGVANNFQLRDVGNFGFSSTTDPAATADVLLARDSANVLGLRNGASPQAFRVYNNFVGPSNYERGTLAFESNILTLGTDAQTGTVRNFQIRIAGTSVLRTNSPNEIDVGIGNAHTTWNNTAGRIENAGGFYLPTPAGASQVAGAIFTVTGAPSNGDGNDGDYCFRTDGGVGTHLYFKSGGTWAGVI